MAGKDRLMPELLVSLSLDVCDIQHNILFSHTFWYIIRNAPWLYGCIGAQNYSNNENVLGTS
jgi:hypothetical protein